MCFWHGTSDIHASLGKIPDWGVNKTKWESLSKSGAGTLISDLKLLKMCENKYLWFNFTCYRNYVFRNSYLGCNKCVVKFRSLYVPQIYLSFSKITHILITLIALKIVFIFDLTSFTTHFFLRFLWGWHCRSHISI